MKRLVLCIATLIMLAPGTARADCTTPNGTESQTVYDFTAHALKICTGTNWVILGGSIMPAGSTGQIQFNTGSGFGADSGLFWDNTSKRLGVGTSAPAGHLDVASTVNTVIAARTYAASGSAAPHFIGYMARGTESSPTYPLNGDGLAAFQGRSGIGAAAWPGMTIHAEENFSATAQGALVKFSTTPVGSVITTERMRITSDGKVGIGTMAPDAHLVISGGAGPAKLVIGADTGNDSAQETNYNPYLIFRQDGAVDEAALFLGQNQLNIVSRMNTLSGIIFRVGSSDVTDFRSVPERMRIDTNGNVGISTTAPAATLDVNGFAKLKKNATAPATCGSTYDGSIALTSATRMCVCDGTSWQEVNSATACTW